jgi:eukaryotic-like serine/threonine-protein kinase
MAFTLQEKISESATTCVYRAFDETLGRDVLLKVLHRHLTHDDQVRQRFVREARACAALRSENIVQVFDLREQDGSPAIIMEYVTGQSLKDVIAEGKQRTYAFTEKVAVHVLRGLAAAHAQRIIHRDIKPGNILVSANGTIKITDFGLAQVAVAPTLTTEGMIVGTPAYFAPEIIRGETADARTDLFSLGATLVETLTGNRLFEGATYSECLNHISLFKPEQLDSLASLSSPSFVAFLKRLMHPHRGQRYASPKEALAALGKLGSSEFAAPKPNRAPRASSRWITVGAAALALLVLAGLYRFMTQPSVDHKTLADSITTIPERSTIQDATQNPVLAVEKLQPEVSPPAATTAQQPADQSRDVPVSVRDSGSIILTSSHNARVQVDSLLVGDLPLRRPLRLAAGPHTIVFTHPSFEPIVRTVRLEPGAELNVAADFLEKAGYLRCVAIPWAEISVDGQVRDTTPLEQPIVLTSGKHRVRFHHPAFADSVWEVSIAPRETVLVSMVFKR